MEKENEIERLKRELDELKQVYADGLYYDTEGLFFTIRQMQNMLHVEELEKKGKVAL